MLYPTGTNIFEMSMWGCADMKKAASMQAMLVGISQGLWEFLPKTTSSVHFIKGMLKVIYTKNRII